MALDPVKNFAKGTLASGITSSDTSLTLQSGEGSRFPDPSTDGEYNCVIWNESDYSDPADDPNREIVRVTAKSTDTFTITRGQEGTSAVSHNISGKVYKMILPFTAKTHDDINTHITATSGNPHNVTKSNVGLGNVPNVKQNLSATSAPTANDDSDDGYAIGSRWIDTTSDKEYVCVDATAGAAVWIETTQSGGGGSSGGLYGINVESLTDDKTLTPGTDEIYQYLNPNGADRNITLDTSSATAGDRFVIRFTGGGSFSLIVKQGTSDIERIQDGTEKSFIYDGTNWRPLGEGTGDSAYYSLSLGYYSDARFCSVAFGYCTFGLCSGVAVGYCAFGYSCGIGIGYCAFGYSCGIGIGYCAHGPLGGAAVGYCANADWFGSAVGYCASGYNCGVGIGYISNGCDCGVGIGYYASGYNCGVGIGYISNGCDCGVGIGYCASGCNCGVGIGFAAWGNSTGIAIGYCSCVSISSSNSIALGRLSCSGRIGQYAQSLTAYNAADRYKHQYLIVGWIGSTLDSTETALTLDNLSNKFVLQADSLLSFRITIIGKDTTNGDSAMYVIEGVAKRDALNNSSLVGSVNKTIIAEDDTTWDANVSVEDGTETLEVRVIGDASDRVNWLAKGEMVELLI